MNRASELARTLREVTQVARVVRFDKEALAAVIPPLHQVQSDPRHNQPRRSWHGDSTFDVIHALTADEKNGVRPHFLSLSLRAMQRVQLADFEPELKQGETPFPLK